VAPGRFADLIAVAVDPLKDISALEQVDTVVKGGIVHKFRSSPEHHPSAP
jgi:imidazolonepropionase-like amidohydrolase